MTKFTYIHNSTDRANIQANSFPQMFLNLNHKIPVKPQVSPGYCAGLFTYTLSNLVSRFQDNLTHSQLTQVSKKLALAIQSRQLCIHRCWTLTKYTNIHNSTQTGYTLFTHALKILGNKFESQIPVKAHGSPR